MQKKNIVLLTGRAGSKSVLKKNVYPILGRPLAFYPMNAAKQAKFVDDIYVSTDCEEIKKLAVAMEIKVIERPLALAADDSELIDSIEHALESIAENINYLITMHCNCGVHAAGLVDAAIKKMDDNPLADSCVSGYIDHSINPFRTRKITPAGTLEPWLSVPQGTSSNRQKIAPCFVLDGAVRVLRYSNCFPPTGSPPFPYLGNQVLYIENTSSGDVHSLDDLAMTEYQLKKMGWTDG